MCSLTPCCRIILTYHIYRIQLQIRNFTTTHSNQREKRVRTKQSDWNSIENLQQTQVLYRKGAVRPRIDSFLSSLEILLYFLGSILSDKLTVSWDSVSLRQGRLLGAAKISHHIPGWHYDILLPWKLPALVLNKEIFCINGTPCDVILSTSFPSYRVTTKQQSLPKSSVKHLLKVPTKLDSSSAHNKPLLFFLYFSSQTRKRRHHSKALLRRLLFLWLRRWRLCLVGPQLKSTRAPSQLGVVVVLLT